MGRSGKKRYSAEIKKTAIAKVVDSGISPKLVAGEIGISVSTLRRWIKESGTSTQSTKPGTKQTSTDARNDYSEQLLRCCYRAFDRSNDAIAIIGKDQHTYCNSNYLKLFGYPGLSDLKTLSFFSLVPSQQRPRIEQLLERFSQATDGPSVELEVHCSKSDGQNFSANIEFSRFPGDDDLVQLTLRQPSDELLADGFQSLVKKDSLTGMFSRQAFLEELHELAKEIKTDRSRSALIFIEIDKFESVQKKAGYKNSDIIIQNLAERIEDVFKDARINARFDCHAFSTILESSKDVDPLLLAKKVNQVISEHVFQLDNQSLSISCSVGVCWINPADKNDVELQVSRAAYACSVAQGAGGNSLHVYDPMEDTLSDEQQKIWTERVINALRTNNNFSMVYQPIVSLHGNADENYEAFLRMNNNSGDEFLPGKFIPAAEQAGLMRVVDRWVIRHAVKLLGERSRPGKQLSIFINLSRDILIDESFIGWLKNLIDEKGISPNSMVFEIGEHDVVTHINQAKNLVKGLKTLSCRVALDHFGSGLNSFSLLEHIDADYLKLDGSLIQDLSSNKASQIALKSITELARSMDKATIAEFVQDASNLATLWQCGVSYIQGYFLQEPSRALNYDFSSNDFT